jgi:hypothetical protein
LSGMLGDLTLPTLARVARVCKDVLLLGQEEDDDGEREEDCG